MAHCCEISNKNRQHGHRVSHAKNRTKHVFLGNIQSKRIWVPELNKMLKLKISTKMLRTIDKIGLNGALRKFGMCLEDIN
jgi:large subunit ribosomal protein L28